MTVSDTQDPQLVRTSPALGRQLLPGVQGEAGATIPGGDPDIAAGPDQVIGDEDYRFFGLVSLVLVPCGGPSSL